MTGLRVGGDGLVQAYLPVLPAQWRALVLHDVSIRGKHYNIRVTRCGGKPAQISIQPVAHSAHQEP